MRSSRERLGVSIASLGAAAVLLSLWLPWYRFQLSDELVQRLNGLSAQFGNFGSVLRQGAAELAAHGPFHLSGWTIFRGFDVALCLIAAGGLLLGLQALGAPGRLVLVPEGQSLAGLGLVAGVLTSYHLFKRPAPHEILALDRGAWVALVGAGAMLGGGLLAGAPAEHRDAVPTLTWEDPTAPVAPADWSTSSSVAPPGASVTIQKFGGRLAASRQGRGLEARGERRRLAPTAAQ